MYEAKFAGVSSPLTASSPLDLHLNSSQSPLCNDIESSETIPSMMSATIRLDEIRWPSFANSSDSRMFAFACLLSTVHTVRTLCLYGIFSHYFDILPEKVLQCRLQYMQWCFVVGAKEKEKKKVASLRVNGLLILLKENVWFDLHTRPPKTGNFF